MEIKNIREFRTWFKNLKNNRQNEWCNENFMGSSHNNIHTGFFGMYHGEKDDIYGFLRKEVEMAEDGQAIYEFVQNAADSGSSQFYMFYNEKYLLAINNGEVFTKEGIKSILNIGQSYGKNDPDKIGRFGIGFKLVHRLVGKSSGLDELLNKDNKGYRGPTLFSWSKKKQFDNFISSDSFIESDFENNDAPWLLKILLTNFPAFPGEEVLDVNYNANIPYPISEALEFQTYLYSVKNLIDLDEMHQGTIFFIKLGENKSQYLDKQKEEYFDGLSTSMHFLKSLKLIKINKDDIRKDKDASNSKFFRIKNNTAEYNKIGLTEDRDKISDIQFHIRYANDSMSAEIIKSHPNIYKYFPAVKEVNKLAFIIHSNVFELTSNRQNLPETTINIALLKLLAKTITDEMEKCKDLSSDEYHKVFGSIMFSDEPNSTAGSGWQKEHFYQLLHNYAKDNVPTAEGKYISSTNVIIKKTQLNVNPGDLGIQKQWFFQSASKSKKLVKSVSNKFGIEKWTISKLIENGSTEKINTWITSLNADEYLVLLEELNKYFPRINIEDIEFIKSNLGFYYSLNDIKRSENRHFIFYFNKIQNVLEILINLEFTHSIFNIDEYKVIREYVSREVKYLEKSHESDLVKLIENRIPIGKLSAIQKKDLFLCLSDLYGVGSTVLSEIKLFSNSENELTPLNKLIDSKLNDVPDWLRNYTILDSENILEEIRNPDYLRNTKTIYSSILHPYWNEIIDSGEISHSNIEMFYQQVKKYYSQSKPQAEPLKNFRYVFNGKKFFRKDKIYFNQNLKSIYSGYQELQGAIKSITGLFCPDKNIVEFFTSAPFTTVDRKISDYSQDCKITMSEAIKLLEYCDIIDDNIFRIGYFVKAGKRLLYKHSSEIKQYYSTEGKLNAFIKNELHSKFHRLPSELSKYKQKSLRNSELQKAILKELGRECEYHIELLVDILDENGIRSVIDRVDKIRFEQKGDYTNEDYEYKIISAMKREQINGVKNKLVIATENKEFSLGQSYSSSLITFHDGKYKIQLADILPASQRYENAKTISEIRNTLKNLRFNADKIDQIFDIESEYDDKTYREILDELLESENNVVKNESQLAFVLLYNNFIENISLDEIEAHHANNEIYAINCPLYLNNFSFISNSDILDAKYHRTGKILKINKDHPIFSADNSNCKMILSPHFDEENEVFVCPKIKTSLNELESIGLLMYLFDYWGKSMRHKRIIQKIIWDNISDEDMGAVIGFNPIISIWSKQYATKTEKCPAWIKTWGKESTERMDFLCDFGINTKNSPIHKLRKSLFSDSSFPKNDIPNNDKLSDNLLANSFEWIENNGITFKDESKFELVKAIADELDYQFDIILDENQLRNNSIEFNDYFHEVYYNAWKSNHGYSIFFYDGEMPYRIRHNDYTLKKQNAGDLAEIDDHIYLNMQHYKYEKHLIGIDVLHEDAKHDLWQNIINNISNPLDNSSELQLENKKLKEDLRKATSIDFVIPDDNDVLPHGGGLSQNERMQRSREYKDRVKQYLDDKNYDVSNWSEKYAHIQGVVDPTGEDIEILIKGTKGGKLYISPVEWIALSVPNSMLVVIDTTDEIVNVPFEELMKTGNQIYLQFRSETFSRHGISEFAKVFQYVSDCKFIIDSPGFSYFDFMTRFGLSEKQEGIISSSSDNEF